MPGGDFAPLFRELVALEQQVSDTAAAADPRNKIRVYPWRPSGPPELPAIWNWIDDGSYEIPDTARGDDILVVTASIGVRPSDLKESMDRLVVLTDHFRHVVDPALSHSPPLNGAAKRAKRIVTRTSIELFNDVPVMCMDLLMQFELHRIVVGPPTP